MTIFEYELKTDINLKFLTKILKDSVALKGRHILAKNYQNQHMSVIVLKPE